MAVTGLLRLALGGLGAHVNRVCYARGGDGGWSLQQAAMDGDSSEGGLNKRKLWVKFS